MQHAMSTASAQDLGCCGLACFHVGGKMWCMFKS